ncbi:uncharacterized protein RHIMIDRAFT_40567 [Rhizopus microsporus ATCC 52813]|uniref:C2H2-type domain-containing protein n=2 Tax=Rhizopus microsporus TaxID=58291 RepID=A0A2G4SMD9_RHIZD|nr:uncharacterized protein RHIMIDRAFT_40567 [Rhizopus microsporus ATCC 52813]PHZ09920.1 hypothetical protein RHIMIDRAFT_40567 [Rhizopus microsporus ATCC 52813]
MKVTHSQNNNNSLLSSLDNIISSSQSCSSSERIGSKRSYKSIQPSPSLDYANKRAQKENYRHIFHENSTKTPSSMKKLVSQTFTTDEHHERVESTKSRPTMGGKTIGSIAKTTDDEPPLSSQELKLLSRRINPLEPLPSPHASPRKPPLPNIKRQHARTRQYSCEPCNKHYKTRNGLVYHLERCKHRKLEVKVIIQCVCSHNVTEGTMIECTQCHTWLHIKCVQPTEETTFVCPRCLPAEDNKTEEDDSFDFSNLFSEDSFNAFMDEQTAGLWGSDFNSTDWYNSTTDIPSLLLSDNGLMDGYPTSELLSSSNVPSSPLESDWLNFTNLDDDATNQEA